MTQPLSDIVNVTVQVSPADAQSPTFNLGLIVGTSAVIPTATRTKVYSGTDDMLAQGWAGTEPEFKAAQAYFAQTPRPTNVVIGRQDLTTTPAETPLQAVQACRPSNTNWYGCYVCGPADSDISAIAGYIQTATPTSALFYDTSEANVLSGTVPNIMNTLKGSNSRTLGLYSTTNYAGAAVLGVAMGSNTGLADSAFTLDFKALSGVTPEALTSSQYATITGCNGNVYTNFGSQYNLLTKGTMSDGTPFDQILNQDQIVADIQTQVTNVLTTAPKVPQTDAGVSRLVSAVNKALQSARSRNVLAPGIWTNAPVLGLNTGDMLSNGYLTLADRIANQSSSDRAARKAPPIYACCKFAGAIQSVTIGVVVNL